MIEAHARNTATISIVIPFHNRQNMLNALLASIPDIPEIEVIVVDDHSTDDVTVSRRFDDATMKLIEAPDGVRFAGAARNLGMRHAVGKFLCFADSDDLFATHVMECVAQQLSDPTDTDVFYGCQEAFLDGSGEKGTRHVFGAWLLWMAEKTGCNDYLMRLHRPVAKFVRRSFAEKHRLRFSETEVSNDVMFNLRLCAADGVCEILDDTVYFIRQGNASLTNTRSRTRIWTRFEIQEIYNREMARLGKGYLASPGLVYVLQMCRFSLRDAARMALRCVTGVSPFVSLATSARFRLLLAWHRRTGRFQA